ncbi:MAG: DUF456 domain-containing protein [Bacteroidia bacterium]|nr:DUF456 domain-containing protein [Bacteroidia bacterium]
MDTILIIIGVIFLILGIIGSFVPVLPGPPLSYLSLLLLQFTSYHPFSARFLVIWAIVTAAIVVLDYVVPAYGTKVFGGTKKGQWGALIGVFAGIFFLPPIGIIAGPFIGALVGEILAGKQSGDAFRAAFGSFLGFLAGTFMKLALSLIFVYYFIRTFV